MKTNIISSSLIWKGKNVYIKNKGTNHWFENQTGTITWCDNIFTVHKKSPKLEFSEISTLTGVFKRGQFQWLKPLHVDNNHMKMIHLTPSYRCTCEQGLTNGSADKDNRSSYIYMTCHHTLTFITGLQCSKYFVTSTYCTVCISFSAIIIASLSTTLHLSIFNINMAGTTTWYDAMT